MGKIRDWMHGSGRKTVIAVVTVIAAAIVIHYFVVERHGKWGLESAYSAGVNETVSPKPQKDYYVGGSSIGGVDKNTKISTGDTIKKTELKQREDKRKSEESHILYRKKFQ